MATTPSQHQVIKFGVFEVDLAAGEVRKAGMRQKVSGQPFQVLQALLERPQEIVTRDELRERLWPGNTFVDYELALKKAVNRLREVLGDSAENPHIIETVPRRGYRFIAPLSGARVSSMFDSPISGAESPVAKEGGSLSIAPRGEWSQTKKAGLRYTILIVAGTVLVSTALLSYALTHRLPPPRVTGTVQLTSDGQGKTASYVNELASPLVSDGSRLYFVECAIGSARLAEVSMGGGETTVFPTEIRVRRVLDASPSRRELLALGYDGVRIEAAVMVLPLPAGAPHRLGGIVAHDANWSPDGKRIVYANGHDRNSTRRRCLVASLVAGRKAGALHRSEGLSPRRLWEVSTDGSGLHRFSGGNQDRDECCGNWTPDGRHFVFQSEDQLWAIREGAGFLRKTREPERAATGPMSIVAPLPSADDQKDFCRGCTATRAVGALRRKITSIFAVPIWNFSGRSRFLKKIGNGLLMSCFRRGHCGGARQTAASVFSLLCRQ